jgi:HAD domain in Swiss Army Knife RNA repair proteins
VRVIFLDVDGVLNNGGYWQRVPQTERNHEDFDPDSVEALNLIVEKSKARFVISSTWRLHHTLREMRSIFRRNGVKGVILDFTPEEYEVVVRRAYGSVDKPRQRGYEIATWLDEQEVKPEGFVIIDDDSDMAHLMEFLVKTDSMKGLQMEHVEPALKILMR